MWIVIGIILFVIVVIVVVANKPATRENDAIQPKMRDSDIIQLEIEAAGSDAEIILFDRGLAYIKGDGVEKNKSVGMALMKKAADLGNEAARNRLAMGLDE